MSFLDYKSDNIKVYHGDCFEALANIQDESIDMILVDPPYGTIQDLNRNTSWDVALDTKKMMNECFRVLKNGRVMCVFAQDPYTTEIITNNHGNMRFSYRYIWLKNHFGNPMIASKSPVNMFEDVCVFQKRAENRKGHPLQQWFNDCLAKTPFSVDDMIKMIGNGGVRHHFTNGKVFRVPSKERYEQIQMISDKFDMSHDDLMTITESCKVESSPKVFNLKDGERSKSNVLKYDKDKNGIHPTQKPVALLRDLITTYSNKSETVLDFTMGSGSTGVAALMEKRSFIGVEQDENYFINALNRLIAVSGVTCDQ